MARVSILQQMYSDQNRSTDGQNQNDKKKKYCKGNRCFCLRWILIGLLTGSIPLAVIVILYVKQGNYKTVCSPPPALLRWNTTGITVAGVSRVAGNANNQLNLPYDAQPDYSDTLYIADSGNNRVQKYLRNSFSGTTIAGQTNGTGGSAANQLRMPSVVIVNSNGDMFVADSGNYRIQFWAKDSLSGITVAGTTGIFGPANNQFSSPYGLARNLNTGTLYIADYTNHRVMSYESGASSGTVAAGGNGPGLNQTQLNLPVALYFDSLSNSLVIVNSGANNVVRWTIGATNWTLLAGSMSGAAGNTSTSFNFPRYVTFDPMGNMYVADRNNHRIQFFPVGQSSAITIAGVAGTNGSSASLLNIPTSIAFDGQLNMYVADRYNHRIQKFVRY